MHKYFVLICIFTSIYLPVLAQLWGVYPRHNYDTTRRWCISLSPQHAFVGQMRIEIDNKITYNNWTTLSVKLYNVNHQNYNFGQLNSVKGAGLNFFFKRFFQQIDYPVGFFADIGICYDLLTLTYKGGDWTRTERDGQIYYELNNIRPLIKLMHKIGTESTVGYRTEILPNLFVDMYIGLSLRTQYSNIPKYLYVYDELWWDYAYKGVGMLLGIRIGAIL